ncbi:MULTISPECIES: cyclase family protein [unclassified Sulfitobacter]|jgi:kynurenine formamidase|uniref:cyclase family protein n=1 Tax=unclassified Sulfitobacter TaxID=196795 RepID=UPI0007C37EA9|nr:MULTISPECIES: cyclase family protein [unclassified Sulfitobacter]KZX95097.1 cyclase [Sulfitobacter sp. HI0023]KZZ69974.1 cyclase [Sulfitobacter sp. HI0129]
MRQIIDLSIPIDAFTPADPPFQVPVIDYVAHDRGAEVLCAQFPGLSRQDLPGGHGWAVETLTLSTHNGTHLDAPWHYHPTMNGGERAWTIDEVPLNWCYQPGVKLDFRHFPDGYIVTPADIDTELERIGCTLSPLQIVLVNTSAGAAFGAKDYIDRGCGVGREATLHLLDMGVRVTGTDGWSWDAPFSATASRYAESGDASIIWEGHKAGKDRAYCHLEKLTNLDSLPSTGFDVICLPVKVAAGSAGWTRAVAILS